MDKKCNKLISWLLPFINGSLIYGAHEECLCSVNNVFILLGHARYQVL